MIYVNIGSTMLNKTMRYVYRILKQTLDRSIVFEIVKLGRSLREVETGFVFITLYHTGFIVSSDPVQSYFGDILNAIFIFNKFNLTQ